LNTNSIKNTNKIIFFILLLAFCGHISVIRNSNFYNSFDFLSILSPIVDIREFGNYKVFFINNIVIICILFLAIYLPRLIKDYGIKRVEFFFVILLFYRPLNDIIINFPDVFKGKVGILLTYSSFIVIYLLILMISRSNKENLANLYNIVKKVFIISGLINSIVIIIQFLIEYHLYYQGFSIFESFRFIRPISLMGVVTVNSMFIGFSCIFLIDSLFKEENKKMKLLLLLGLFLLIIGEVFTSSRGGLLVLILIGSIHVILNINRKKVISLVIVGSLILLPLLSLIIILFKDFFDTYIETVFLSNSASSSNDSRLFKWKLALNFFKENPLLGIGTQQFGILQSQLTNGWSSSNPHNLMLQLLSENGLIYTLYFYGVLIYFLITYYKKLKNSEYYPIYFAILYWFFSSFYMGVLDNLILGLSFVILLALGGGVSSNLFRK
jgi:O-antigen ligase